MLVLTRKAEEGIVVGDDIVITILEIKGGNIRIGIDAPGDTKIYRQEVYDRVCHENREAMEWTITDLNALSESLAQQRRRNDAPS